MTCYKFRCDRRAQAFVSYYS